MAKYKKRPFGHITNIHGVNISRQEREELKKRVDRVRMKRNYYRKKYQGVARESFTNRDPVIFNPRKLSQDLNKFKSREDFERYMNYAREASSKEFISQQSSMFKENIIEAIKKVYGSDGDEVVRKLEELTHKQFQYLVVKYPLEFSVAYWYRDPDSSKIAHMLTILEEAKDAPQ